jgi:hypothetical protein
LNTKEQRWYPEKSLTKMAKIKRGRVAVGDIRKYQFPDNRLDQNELDNAEVDNRRIAKSDGGVTKLIRVAAGEWSNKKSVLLDETQRIESIIRLKMQKDGMRKESKS